MIWSLDASYPQRVLEGHSQAVTAVEILANGWIVSDLEEKFPDLVPPEVSDPRVMFHDDRVRFACRILVNQVSTVLSIELEPYLTEQRNELAVRLCKVRAGSLPIPLGDALDQIAETVNQHSSGFGMKWLHQDGDPIALITLPDQHRDLREGAVLEVVDIRDGELLISGQVTDQQVVADSEEVNVKRHR